MIASGCVAALVFAGCTNKAATQPTTPSLGLSQDLPIAVESARLSGAEERAQSSRREPWVFGDYSGQLIITPNYRIYTTITDERILTRLPLFYEGVLERYTTELAPLPKPPQGLDTYLFQTRTQWQAKSVEMLPDQARMFESLGRGGFATRGTAVLYYIDRYGYTRDTFAIAAHEGWHQYTQRTFKHQLPMWLEEGVATYMEGYRSNREGVMEFAPASNFERREKLREAVRRNRMIPLNDLLTRSPQAFLNSSKDSLLIYYAQVWALTRFLAEGEGGRYKDALTTVLVEAAEGRMVSRVLTSRAAVGARRSATAAANRAGPVVVQEYFNRDLAEFERQYLAFVDQIVQSAGSGNQRRTARSQ